MLRLRQYKPCDAKSIISWFKDEKTFLLWGGERFGNYPITEEIMNNKYLCNNGDCEEEDNFYPWTATDEEGNAVGHFIMRYINGDKSIIRFGWVILDDKIRGKGYGKQMLLAGLKYAFEIYKAEEVTIGVFQNNNPAHYCYKSVGFKDKEIVKGDYCNIIEMKITKEDYFDVNK